MRLTVGDNFLKCVACRARIIYKCIYNVSGSIQFQNLCSASTVADMSHTRCYVC